MRTVAVTAGYVCPEPRVELFSHIDAANVDLKGFTEDFYRHVCGGHLAAVLDTVLDTVMWLRHETTVWLELTTLLIPGLNDSDDELDRLSAWVVDKLGPDVPLHFSAFHPDFKLVDRPRTPPETLTRARRIAVANGVRHAYTGNVHDAAGGSTWCAACGECLIERDWYELGAYRLTCDGRCRSCGAPCPGVFDGPPGAWGSRRLPVRLGTGA